MRFAFVDPDDEQIAVSFNDARFARHEFTPKEGGTVTHCWRLQVHPQNEDVSARILSYLHRPDLRGALSPSDDADDEDQHDD
ncbi:hypothetical protein BG60_28965 [Caballeronia zhejiangensis]|uniref:Uncharacterized protein n=1 Tax=Caballeronia zhejiangensis TaxID=871203 RepID=A0A656QRV8_9BURK|nr:hypothetical protein BG60_28965 [Caballeronia zhejiangensis]